MPGGPPRHGRRPARGPTRTAAVAGLLGAGFVAPLLLGTAASAVAPPATAGKADGIHLSTPVEGVDPLTNVDRGLRRDRRLRSVVPGRVRDEEQVRVEVGASGVPARVTDRQRLVIDGAGNYIVRELGPAREAVGL